MMPRPHCFGTAAGAIVALACLATGCGNTATPPVVPKAEAPVAPRTTEAATIPDVKFVDITESSGLTFVHENAMAGDKLLPETMGSGCAFLDYDGDGDADLLLVNSKPWSAPTDATARAATPALYRNDGQGKFTDVTAEAGLAIELFGMGVATGDYDNDGDSDVYLTGLSGGHLLRNDGGKFADVTTEANAGASQGWLTSAAFFDLENDGDLDLFVCSYVEWSAEFDRAQAFPLAGVGRGYGPPKAFGGTYCVLLRNDAGKFTDVSAEAGVQVRTFDAQAAVAKSLGVAPWDIDGDGLVDLTVANDTTPNFLFHNLGGGKFEEVATVSGVAFDSNGSTRGAMGIDWAHFLNDETVALAIGNFANEMTALYVSEDPARLLFSDQANLFGLGAPSQPPLKFGLFWFDYDLDGRQDLLTVNGHLESDIEKTQASMSYAQAPQLFWNTGRRGPNLFALVGPAKAGPDLFRPIVGRGSAYADIDGDGDLDVVLTANGGPARLYRNDGGSNHRWVRLKLVGRTPGTNREAIGARVSLKSNGKVQRRQLFPAKGYLSSVELPLTFGLGASGTVEEVVIRWPSGRVSELPTLEAGELHVIEEPDGPRPDPAAGTAGSP